MERGYCNLRLHLAEKPLRGGLRSEAAIAASQIPVGDLGLTMPPSRAQGYSYTDNLSYHRQDCLNTCRVDPVGYREVGGRGTCPSLKELGNRKPEGEDVVRQRADINACFYFLF